MVGSWRSEGVSTEGVMITGKFGKVAMGARAAIDPLTH
jgi:hypothetical protein